MKKESVLLIAVALVIGLLLGILISKGGRGKGGALTAQAPAQAPAVNYQEKIRLLEGLVAKDPANRSAWVQLGHTYFDSQQAAKAVEAYDKALALDPNDPDVLTDQGVMYRQLGWFDRAVDNFEKANRINPSHMQSLFNLGVVYRYDLNDYPRAIEAWERFLQLNPSGPGAEQIRGEMEFLRTHPQVPGGPGASGPTGK
ncbi:MAG: tetratricopeptide repeat protein [Desulfuromonadales bacterium]|jgi:cytochrome c-type biogenesis protein CcmH/NrfG